MTDDWIGNLERLIAEKTIDRIALAAKQFSLGKGKQFDDLDPSGERVPNCWKRHDIGRACQQKPARRGIGVDGLLDDQHQLRCALDFVNDCAIQVSDEADRITLGIGQRYRVVERQEWPLIVSKFADQRGFSCLTRPHNQHHAGISKRGSNGLLGAARNKVGG